MFARFIRPLQADERFMAASVPALAERGNMTINLGELGLGNGCIHAHDFAGTLVTVVEGRLDRDLRARAQTERDLLLIRASLDSSCTYVPLGVAPWRFRKPEVTVSVIPCGATFEVDVEAGAAQRTVTVLLEPRVLLAHHAVDPAELPPPLRRLAEGRLDRASTVAVLPIEADLASLVHDLTRSRLTGSLRRMQAHARSAELLALVAAAWNEHLAGARVPGMRARDAQIVAVAQRLLAEQFTDPPPLQELAARLGTNRNKLNRLFVRATGTSPQAWCLKKRIERAQSLIVDGRLSLGQVAEAVGYRHHSSFTVAFRSVVGMSPREFALRQFAPTLAARPPALH